MVLKKFESKTNKYIVRFNRYTSKGWICVLYKKIWIFYLKVFDQLYLRNTTNREVDEMIESTISKYEETRLIIK